MRSSLNTTTGSLNKSGQGIGGSVNLSSHMTSSMSLPVYSTEYDDEVVIVTEKYLNSIKLYLINFSKKMLFKLPFDINPLSFL